MTGIERLREFADGISPFTTVCGVTTMSYDREHKEVVEKRLRDFLSDIAKQIERERACDADAVENIRLIVGGVIDEMKRHVSGVEGADDSPVARWARELRGALKSDASDGSEAQSPSCADAAETADVTSEDRKVTRDPAADVSMSAYDLLPEEDRDAVAWVREHGGLDSVKAQRRESMPRAAYERKKAGFLGHIAECETALGRRSETISELNHRACDLTRENAELRKRAMPEGYEWPRFESGEPVMLGDSVTEYVAGGEFEVRSIEFRDGAVYLRECYKTDRITIVRPGERVKRPTHKVLDADGVETRVGDEVWDVESGIEYEVVGIHTDEDTPVRVMRTDGSHLAKAAKPSTLTHRAPVLAADGRPLREGETVWDVSSSIEFTVIGLPRSAEYQAVKLRLDDGAVTGLDPDRLTHKRPDSFEQLEKDANDLIYDISFYFGDYSPRDFKEKGDSVQDRVRDLVRRAKKLAGVDK